MDCDLCISGDYDLDCGPEFYNVKDVKSRKPFKCCECRRAFPAGTTYERISGKWDGEVDTIKTCLDCADIRSSFFCEGFVYGNLWSDWGDSEGFQRMTTACLQKLSTASAKAYLVERWNRWKFDR